MKKLIKNIFGPLLLLTVVVSSCKKEYLDEDPPTSLTPEAALTSEADLLAALRGAYQGLRATDLYGRTVPVLGDLIADNIYVSTLNTGRYTNYNNYTYVVNDGNVSGLWSSAYTVIMRANNIINSPLTGTTNINQYKGEAYAVRALCYFTLVRYFATPYTDNPSALGVPLVTVYDPDLKPARNTVSEVYTLILDDLSNAYNLMTSFTNSSQFSKYAARALQAKVYLTMGNYSSAKTSALDVISNGGFSVVSSANYAAFWANAAVRTDKVETLFEVSSDAVGNNGFDALSYLYSRNGNYGDLLCSDDLNAKYEAADVRKALLFSSTRGGLPALYVDKYPAISGDRSDTKVIRLSEMYLIAAEASYSSNSTEAQGYVNYITSRRGASAISSTGSQLLEDIITERQKELAFEGERYMDMQRLKRNISRSANYPSSAQSLPYSNFRRLLPIPESEVNANPNIATQQNPGYN